METKLLKVPEKFICLSSEKPISQKKLEIASIYPDDKSSKISPKSNVLNLLSIQFHIINVLII